MKDQGKVIDQKLKTSNSAQKTKPLLNPKPYKADGAPLNSVERPKSSMQKDFPSSVADKPFTHETRAYIWALMLKNEKLVSKLVTDDELIKGVQLDLANQRVIKNDCLRTRVGIFEQPLKDDLERLLTFYCKKEKIGYKQGLNEVAAPFINFKLANVHISNIYNYLVLFIEKFLPNTFIDKDFLSLQCCFRILNILLKYHDPALHTFLTINDYPPEIYATPWFLTLFASKLKLDIVYLLWDIFILENDPFFIFFIALSLLIENKNLIIASDPSLIPQNLTAITIDTVEQCQEIYARAIDLRSKTPTSFLYKLNEIDIFKKGYTNDDDMRAKMQFNVDYLEHLQSVVSSSTEVIRALYSTEIECINPNCKNFEKKHGMFAKDTNDTHLSDGEFDRLKSPTSSLKEEKVRNSFYGVSSSKLEKKSKSKCFFCDYPAIPEESHVFIQILPHLKDIMHSRRGVKKQLDYIVIDLRQNKDDGLLPKSHPIDLSKLNNDTINQLINDFIELRSQYHFVFMISSFSSNNFKDSKDDKKKSINVYNRSGEKKAISKNLTEDMLLYRFIDEFLENGFPFISILEGGWNEINKQLHDLKLELLNHDPKACSICNADDHKNPLMNFVNRVIDKTGQKLNLFVEGMQAKTPNKSNIQAGFSKTLGGNESKEKIWAEMKSSTTHTIPTEPSELSKSTTASAITGAQHLNSINRPSFGKSTSSLDDDKVSMRDSDVSDLLKLNNFPSNEIMKDKNLSPKVVLNNQQTNSQEQKLSIVIDKNNKNLTSSNSKENEAINKTKTETLNASRYVFGLEKSEAGFSSPTVIPETKKTEKEYYHGGSSQKSIDLSQNTNQKNYSYTNIRPDLSPVFDSSKYSQYKDVIRSKSPRVDTTNSRIEKVGSVTSNENTQTLGNQSSITIGNRNSNISSPKGLVDSKRPNGATSPRSQREFLEHISEIAANKSNSSSKALPPQKSVAITATTQSASPNRRDSGYLFGQSHFSNRSMDKTSIPTKAEYLKKSVEIERTEETTSNMTSPVQEQSKNVAISEMIQMIDKEKKAVITSAVHEYFYNNGIFEPSKLTSPSHSHIYKLYLNKHFELYVCDHVKEFPKDDVNLYKVVISPEYLSKRIITVNKDYMISYDYNEALYQNFKLLQKGANLESLFYNTDDSNQKISSNTVDPRLNSSNMLYRATQQNKVNVVMNIRSVYPVKLLLRITSKKFNGRYLSFYFKLPCYEKVKKMGVLRYFRIADDDITAFTGLCDKEDYLTALKEISDIKDPQTIIQSKSIYCFESEQISQECIQKTKESYSHASAYLNEKLQKLKK